MIEETKENQKLEDMDRMALEVARQRRAAAIAAAEAADLAHKNLILQLFMKYGLSQADSIREDSGEIVRGGALPADPKVS